MQDTVFVDWYESRCQPDAHANHRLVRTMGKDAVHHVSYLSHAGRVDYFEVSQKGRLVQTFPDWFFLREWCAANGFQLPR